MTRSDKLHSTRPKFGEHQPLRSQTIPAEQLANALSRANRAAGWNFRETPIRRAFVGNCVVYIVPAKIWAYGLQRANSPTQASDIFRHRKSV